IRTRAAEFAATEGKSKKELLAALSTTIKAAKAAIVDLTETEMVRERKVQAYVHDGTFILLHVVEHLSYHTGQIIFWTKAMNNIDLDFYGGVDLEAKG
ncbi:MAG: DUF1572 family protein, partial [Bacteroidota bacterium]